MADINLNNSTTGRQETYPDVQIVRLRTTSGDMATFSAGGGGISGVQVNGTDLAISSENKVNVKVAESETNGNILVNDVETSVYTHPAATPNGASFRKVGNDAMGHVLIGSDVAKEDITALVNPVTTTADDVGLMTAADKVKLNAIEPGAQVNVLEGLTVGGTEATITDKKIAITTPSVTYTTLPKDYFKINVGGQNVQVSGVETAISRFIIHIGSGTENGTLKYYQFNPDSLEPEITDNIAVKGLKTAAYIDKSGNTWDTVTNGTALDGELGLDLNTRILNLEGRGRFLSNWNCSTGLPTSNPSTTSPYEYQSGDYYIVSVLAASGSNNYKPDGSEYVFSPSPVASTVVESNEVSVGDTYTYDGTSWSLIHGASQSVTFSQITGSPSDNTNLNAALNAKANATDLTAHINDEDSHVTIAEKATWNGKQNPATTLAGYGITDAKIDSGEITLGSNTIIPIRDVKVNNTSMVTSRGIANISADSTPQETSTNLITSGAVYTALSTKEDKSNKVSSVSSSSTDEQYPTAKCLYEATKDTVTLTVTLEGGTTKTLLLKGVELS